MTWLGLMAIYLTLPLAFLVLWFVDLWAKSYDLPVIQLFAKATLMGVSAVLAAGLAHLGWGVWDGAGAQLGPWVIWVALSPAAVGFVACLGELNWRCVYAAALVGGGAALRLEGLPRPLVLFLGAMLLAILVLAAYNETPHVRVARYAYSLRHHCSCCGYKQRAVHELRAAGPSGEQVISEYLRALEGWQETRVREAWARCRPTTGCS